MPLYRSVKQDDEIMFIVKGEVVVLTFYDVDAMRRQARLCIDAPHGVKITQGRQLLRDRVPKERLPGAS